MSDPASASEPAAEAQDGYFAAAPDGLSDIGAQVRRSDPDRFEAALFAAPALRESLYALYAFNLELARAPWRTQEPHIALMRLQFWRDVVAAAAQREPPRAHEIAEPINALVAEGRLDAADLEALIAARESEIEQEGVFDAAAFDAYLSATGGRLTAAAAQLCLGRPLSPEETRAARAAGAASALARLLEATPILAAHGRVMLPLDRPDRAALLCGETTEEARRLIAALAAERRAALDAEGARLPRAARPALLAGWRAGRILKAAAQPQLDVFTDFGPESPARRRLSLLWRAWRWRSRDL